MAIEDSANRQPALIVTTLGSFVIPLMGSSINIALPSIGKEFDMDALMLGWVTTSYLLTSAMFLVPFGRIADIYGRKRIFLYGFLVFTLASLLAGLSPSSYVLIASRAFQGVGASMTFSNGVAILTSVYPVGEKGRVLGINLAAVYAGLSGGPFLGGVLTHYMGWRSIFLINILAGLIILFYTRYKLKGEWAEARGENFNYRGSLFYSLVLLMVMVGLFQLPNLWGVFFILIGLFGMWVFIKWEMTSDSPVFRLTLFRNNRIFTFSNLATLIHYSATFAVSFLLSLYLQLIKGLRPHEAGLILVSAPIMQAILSPFAGKLSDRIDPRKVASWGMAITGLGLLLFVFIDEKTSLPLITAYLILLGVGFALFSSPNTNAVMGSIDKKFYGVASGILSTMRSMGMIFSMGFVMVFFSISIGRSQITPDLYPLFLKSVRGVFILFTFLCTLAILASLARGPFRSPSNT
jgi:EmrB/QacA subfamily drug resistance transporter